MSPEEIKQHNLEKKCRFEAAKFLLPGWRSLQGCCCRVIDDKKNIQVMYAQNETGNAIRFGGTARCGSVWVCPHCAPAITEGRAQELTKAVDAWKKAGNSVAMITLTFSHKNGEALKTLLDGMRDAQKSMRESYVWKQALKDAHIQGVVRALEVTWGQESGWHPHLHMIVFLHGTHQLPTRLQILEDQIFDIWLTVCRKAGLGLPTRKRGINTVCGESVSERIAQYVAKFGREPVAQWGIERELAKSHTKRSQKNISQRFTPFGLLDAWRTAPAKFKAQFAVLWLEFATAFKGQRQLVWQRGLKAAIPGFLIDERTDQQIAETQKLPDETQITEITTNDWYLLARYKLINEMREKLLSIPSQLIVKQFISKAHTLNNTFYREREKLLRPPPPAALQHYDPLGQKVG